MKSVVKACVPFSLMIAVCAHAEPSASVKTEATDEYGTKITTESSQKDTVGWNGAQKTKIDEKRVVDPKGLGNKTTEEYHARASVKPNGEAKESVTTRDKDGTTKKTVRNTDVKVHRDGSETVTIDSTETTDPKGLFNKKKSKSETIVKHNTDGSVTVDQKVDGKPVVGPEKSN